jgi:hypothetical protein
MENTIQLMYGVEKLNINSLGLIFLQGLPFITWLINSKLQVWYWIIKKRRSNVLPEKILENTGAFAGKIIGKISRAS